MINEFINVALRGITNKIPAKELLPKLDFIEELFIVVPNTINTSRLALQIKEKYKFSYWDSLILASALENNCTKLLTEDLQHNQIIMNDLQIFNPFV